MLQVIKAEDVRDGEPRIWLAHRQDMPHATTRTMHTSSRRDVGCQSCEFAIVDRPAPSTAVQPTPVLDLDALAEAERVMTANLAVEAGSVPLGDTGDYDAYIHIVDRDGRVVVIMNSPEADRSLALARGIVALHNAAPHLIAEARAAVVLRQELAEVAHMLAVATSRYDACVTKLTSAKRLGLEACAHARALARGAPDVSTRDESVDVIVDALEKL